MAKKSLILGYGISGKGAEKLFKKQGKPYLIWEDNLATGIQNPDLDQVGFQNILEVVVSPGIKPQHDILQKAAQHHIPIRTELDLGLDVIKAPIVAVTGTNGKSTTTAMIAYGLSQLGHKALLAGNIGTPLAELAAEGNQTDYIVLELSSYQLHYLQRHELACTVFTNFTPDHEAWHGSSQKYFEAKWRGIDLLGKKGHLVASPEVLSKARLFQCPVPAHVKVHEISTQKNALFAATAIQALTGKSLTDVLKILASFPGLSHRIEKIGTIKGRPIWNDSKATNFESLDYGLRLLKDERFILLVGGRLKNDDFELLTARSHADRLCIEKVITFGESHKKLKDTLAKHYPQIESFPTLAAALDSLVPRLQANPQAVLLSPGGSSFDEFTNFAQRGEFFRAKITPILD